MGQVNPLKKGSKRNREKDPLDESAFKELQGTIFEEPKSAKELLPYKDPQEVDFERFKAFRRTGPEKIEGILPSEALRRTDPKAFKSFKKAGLISGELLPFSDLMSGDYRVPKPQIVTFPEDTVKKKIEVLYKASLDVFGEGRLGTLEEFATKLQDQKKRRIFYNAAKKHFGDELGSFGLFTAKVTGQGVAEPGEIKPTVPEFLKRRDFGYITEESPYDTIDESKLLGPIEYPIARIAGGAFERPYRAFSNYLFRNVGKLKTPWQKEFLETAEALEGPGPIERKALATRDYAIMEAYKVNPWLGHAAILAESLTDVGNLILQMRVLGLYGAGTAAAAGLPPAGPGTMGPILKRLATMGIHGFLTTSGSDKERLQAALYRVGVNMTPFVSTAITEGSKAFLIDSVLNMGISYSVYKDAIMNSKDVHEALAAIIPQFAVDVGMAWNTRYLPSNKRWMEHLKAWRERGVNADEAALKKYSDALDKAAKEAEMAGSGRLVPKVSHRGNVKDLPPDVRWAVDKSGVEYIGMQKDADGMPQYYLFNEKEVSNGTTFAMPVGSNGKDFAKTLDKVRGVWGAPSTLGGSASGVRHEGNIKDLPADVMWAVDRSGVKYVGIERDAKGKPQSYVFSDEGDTFTIPIGSDSNDFIKFFSLIRGGWEGLKAGKGGVEYVGIEKDASGKPAHHVFNLVGPTGTDIDVFMLPIGANGSDYVKFIDIIKDEQAPFGASTNRAEFAGVEWDVSGRPTHLAFDLRGTSDAGTALFPIDASSSDYAKFIDLIEGAQKRPGGPKIGIIAVPSGTKAEKSVIPNNDRVGRYNKKRGQIFAMARDKGIDSKKVVRAIADGFGYDKVRFNPDDGVAEKDLDMMIARLRKVDKLWPDYVKQKYIAEGETPPLEDDIITIPVKKPLMEALSDAKRKFVQSTLTTLKKELGEPGRIAAKRVEARNFYKSVFTRKFLLGAGKLKKLSAPSVRKVIIARVTGDRSGLNEKEAAALDDISTVFKDVDTFAKLLKFRVRKSDGTSYEYKGLGDTYWPEVFRYDITRSFKKVDKLIKTWMERDGLSRPEAEKRLEYLIKQRESHLNPHLEYAREYDLSGWLGDPFGEKFSKADAILGLEKYLTGVADRIASAMFLDSNGRNLFGKDFKTLNDLGWEISDRHDRNIYFEAIKNIRGLHERAPISRLISHIRNYQIVRLLGLAQIPNVFQTNITTIPTVMKLGIRRGLKVTMKGMRELFKNPDFAKEQVGATIMQHLREVSGLSEGTLSGKIATHFLRGVGFSTTESMNNLIAASIGKFYVQELHKAARGEGGVRIFGKEFKTSSRIQLLALKELRNLGYPRTILTKEKLSEVHEAFGAWKLAQITQFRGSAEYLPLFWSSDYGKLLFQFKTFSYNINKLAKDHYIKPAIQYIKTGGVEGTITPLLTFLAGAIGSGEIITYIRRVLIMGKDRPTDVVERLLEDFMYSGALGLWLDAYEAALHGRPLDFIFGPTAGQTGQAATDVVRGKPGKAAVEATPIVRTVVKAVESREEEQKKRGF